MTNLLTRLLLLCGLAAIVLTIAAPAAAADAPGPTNYNTEIIAIEPSTDAFRLEIIGGDAFVSLEQLQPVEIIVPGYRSEPYLRFAPDGTVFENRRSPAVWQNQERYGNGETELPDFVDHTASPQWLEVGSGGRYAWHDHRSHWMQTIPPVNKQPGDQILEASIRLQVDGAPVTVEVASYWIPAPSNIPALLGAAIGLAAAGLAFVRNRSSRAVISLLVAGAAALIGSVAFRSVPPETEPSQLLWILPVLALTAALVLLVVRNHTATTVYLDGLGTAAGAALAVWGFLRFEALRSALIPTNAPYAIDRFTVALALVAGAALAAKGLYGLATPQRLPLAHQQSETS